MAKEGPLLLNLSGISLIKIKKIIDSLSDISQILEFKYSQLASFPFLSKPEIERILKVKQSGALEAELKLIDAFGVRVVDYYDSRYPELLRQISLPPLVLYCKGNLDLLNRYSLAIVGTRNPTQYGKLTAYNFSAELAQAKVIIVSGLAKGLDSCAHRGALDKGGLTVAVLGSGLKSIYPRENQSLAETIFKKGLAISEYPLRQEPFPNNFPRRNRIISGLSQGVIVIEAALRSGALITANFALEQNREVFAVPGKINQKQTKGVHFLLKEGATLVESAGDVLSELNFLKAGV